MKRAVPAPPPPPVDLKAVIARIPALRGKLQAAAAELNQTLMGAEAAILSMRLGVYAGVPMPPDEEGRPRFLSFVRDGKVWLLTVERPATGKLPADSEPLTQTTIRTRTTAVQYLPALLEAMLKKAEEQSAKVLTKTDAVQAFIKNTQKLTGPEALSGRVDRAATELVARLQESGLDIDYDDDLTLVTNLLSKYFLRP